MPKIRKQVEYSCPSCGHSVPVGSPACPGCHRIFKQEDIGNYSLEIEKVRTEADSNRRFAKGAIALVAALFLIFQIMSVVTDQKIKAEDRRMNAIYEEIQKAISEEDYETAMYKVLLLRPDRSLSSNLTEKWAEIKTEMTKLIEQKQQSK